MSDDSLDLICYKYDGWQPRLRPGAPRRAWMDATNERYAYRCLPLTIANSHGWELLSPMAFEAKWDGRDAMEAVEIRLDPGYSPHLTPVTLFGYGTITFHVEAIFRTPPGWNLQVSGPPNRQKDAIQPLGGVIETDWSPYTFTMNWRFTRPDQWIRFEENEPIAFLTPVERGAVERFNPRFERLEDNPDLRAAFEKWSASRNAFQKWVQENNPTASSEKWQKLYFRGLDADGIPAKVDHQSKLRLPPFRFPDGTAMEPEEERACPFRHAPPQPQAALTPPERVAAPANVLLNPASIANPALSLALGRIGFGATPQQQSVNFHAPATDPALEASLKRRDWLLEVQAAQRLVAPAHRAVERVRGIDTDTFRDLYYALSRPVVIEGMLDGWPALDRWTPDGLAAAAGEAMVDVDEGLDAAGPDGEAGSRRMRFADFIAAVAEPGGEAPLALADTTDNRAALAPLDADRGALPSFLAPDGGRLGIVSAGHFASLRFGLVNRVTAQIAGSRHLTLLPPSETRRLHNHRRNVSAVHDITDETRLNLYPLARGAQTFEIDLDPGDALFLPVGWWHQSTALDFCVTLDLADFPWPNATAASFPKD